MKLVSNITQVYCCLLALCNEMSSFEQELVRLTNAAVAPFDVTATYMRITRTAAIGMRRRNESAQHTYIGVYNLFWTVLLQFEFAVEIKTFY